MKTSKYILALALTLISTEVLCAATTENSNIHLMLEKTTLGARMDYLQSLNYPDCIYVTIPLEDPACDSALSCRLDYARVCGRYRSCDHFAANVDGGVTACVYQLTGISAYTAVTSLPQDGGVVWARSGETGFQFRDQHCDIVPFEYLVGGYTFNDSIVSSGESITNMAFKTCTVREGKSVKWKM